MRNVIKNLINSEKAVALGLLVIGATALAVFGKMTIDQWIDYTKWMGAFYVGGKSIQGAAVALGNSRVVAAEAAVELETLKRQLAKSDEAADKAPNP